MWGPVEQTGKAGSPGLCAQARKVGGVCEEDTVDETECGG